MFKRLVWTTQVEVEHVFYTVGKLGISSFQCHKRHSILTSRQKVIAKTRTLLEQIRKKFPVLLISEKTTFGNQITKFFDETSYTTYITHIHQKQVIRTT